MRCSNSGGVVGPSSIKEVGAILNEDLTVAKVVYGSRCTCGWTATGRLERFPEHERIW